MSPKQKAEDLIEKFTIESGLYTKGKKLSIICVDEILNLMSNTFNWSKKDNGNIHYWRDVKEELEKM